MRQKNGATRFGVSQAAAHENSFDAASGLRTQRTTVVFWPDQAIAVGMGWFSALHRHFATQINISLGAPLQVREWRE